MARRRSRSKTWSFHLDFGSHLDRALQREIVGLLLLALGGVTLLGLIGIAQGSLSNRWVEWLRQALGWGAYPVAVAVGALGLVLLAKDRDLPLVIPWSRIIGLEVLFFGGLAAIHNLVQPPDPWRLAAQ